MPDPAHERERLGRGVDEGRRVARQRLEGYRHAARVGIGHEGGEEIPRAPDGLSPRLAGQERPRGRRPHDEDLTAQRPAEVHAAQDVLAGGATHRRVGMVDVQPLGAREEPVEAQHAQAHVMGGGARRRRLGERARKDRVAEGVGRELDRVVADRSQRAEALDDGQVLVQLVAAGEAANARTAHDGSFRRLRAKCMASRGRIASIPSAVSATSTRASVCRIVPSPAIASPPAQPA